VGEEAGEPSSYLTLQPGTRVLSADGQDVGEVSHVLADPEEDIFDGIVISGAAEPGGHVFADAAQIDQIRTDSVVLSLSAEACRSLPHPSANPAALEASPDDMVKHGVGEELQDKLRRAWDLISGNY
jgi:hypothetical protein